ncbi:cytochrome P450 [Brachybacterium sacelli]|uniref:Cytochrome P450 n=1 Tax=Brachybacterium sacelli TaxID=173364 RepID=A0ABS4WVX7_9MICO|nr:cytochrome P450 [Brachybacterium sacelli]MBP2380355.1 cytochrome P450 [Brachybacterium sacelli]
MTQIATARTDEHSPQDFPMPRDGRCPFDPPPTGRALQEEGPLTRVRLADGSTPWFVTRYAEGRKLLLDPRLSSNAARPGYPHPSASAARAVAADAEAEEDGSTQNAGIGFILMDDPEHARLRRMVTAPFAVKRMQAMRPTVQQIADDLLDKMLAKEGPVDLVEEFALPLPSLVICLLLGVPYTKHDFFQMNSKLIVHRDSTPEQRHAAMTALGQYMGELLAEKMQHPEEDIFSDLGRRVHEGEIGIPDAVQMGILLLVAGHETTANMIALGITALLENPEEVDRLREEPDPALVASAVEELMRYLTITHDGRKRVATEDIEIAGVTIRAGEGVIVATDLGNRDAEVFEDPDTLDLGRNPRNHVGFGFGIHQCLGQNLARMELQVVYPTVLARVPTLRLAADVADLPFKHDATIYGLHRLPVTW